MTIKKSRLAAIMTVMLVFSIMVSMLVVPASAAEITETFDKYKVPYREVMAAMMKQEKYPLKADTYYDMADFMYDSLKTDENKTCTVYVGRNSGKMFTLYNPAGAYYMVYGGKPIPWRSEYFYYCDEDEEDVEGYVVKNMTLSGLEPFGTFEVAGEFRTSRYALNGEIAEIVDIEMGRGVFDQIIDLLPIVLVVIVGFIGLRKGIAFLQTVLHSA